MSKTILITGASSGIGKATALFFDQKGWNVIATMRSPEKETELINKSNVLVTKLDVQDQASIEAAIQAGIDRFGRIDALVNNAGYGHFGIFESASPDKVKEQFEVNVFGVMNTIRALLPHFRAYKAGLIVNISSGAGRFTLPLISLYSASKFALEGFSEALSFELAALGIVVKIVEPGGTSTNFSAVSNDHFAGNVHLPDYDAFVAGAGKLFASMHDMRLATAEEVAGVIYEAATDGTDTLRYIVGNEDFRQRIANRQSMPDQEYVNAIRQSYAAFM